jgi:predicted SPOUT superfamily RNA methylase MTH1
MTLTVCIPSSVVREARSKRAATQKLGRIARAAVVFRVDRLVVFPDRGAEGRHGGEFVATVLEYAATPPYLRKEVWGERPELESVGVLPPLRVAGTGSGSNDSESSRQGIVTEVGPDERVRVNCGLQHPISLLVPPRMEASEGERVTVRISSREPVRARITAEPPPGFAVRRADLGTTLDWPDAGVRIGASRHGKALSAARLGPLTERIERDGATVAFGAPERGLPEILGVETAAVADTEATVTADGSGNGADGNEADAGAENDSSDLPGGFDRWLDTIPGQGTETVRTEEALFATLACCNLR